MATLEREFTPWLNQVLQGGIHRTRTPDLSIRKYEPPPQALEPPRDGDKPFASPRPS